jgi:hypothetical protein
MVKTFTILSSSNISHTEKKKKPENLKIRTGSAWKRGVGGEGGDREQGGEMTQTMYTHVNK